MLQVNQLEAYDRVQVLFGLSLSVDRGEILCLLGRNGAGKTTTLKSIMGLLPLRQGSISLDGKSISGLAAHSRPALGIAYVPQGRRLFTELSVRQNLEIGLMASGAGHATLEYALSLFPRLRERLKQRAETLSGGEQQMLAMARAICTKPEVLLLDEPTEGLQPSMSSLIRDVIVEMKSNGVAVVLVEQHVDAVISVADRVTFVEHGVDAETVEVSVLKERPDMVKQYLGV